MPAQKYSPPGEEHVYFSTGGVTLEANLAIPSGAEGIVVFAHGSGSGRFSPRNRYVAQGLNEAKLATLLIDLLTAREEDIDRYTGTYRFDIDLLARRVVGATDWLLEEIGTGHLRIGYFGSSTGAAAALIAAVERPESVGAVVSRGGRPDLAMEYIGRVRAPTLLIVGGADTPVIALNQRAFSELRTEKTLEIIPGATHLFEEAGALGNVVSLARQWFERHLVSSGKYRVAV